MLTKTEQKEYHYEIPEGKIEAQVGWKWKGTNVHSKDYTRIAFFPAEVGTSSSRGRYNPIELGEECIEDVSGSVESWNYKPGDQIPQQFEVLIVHRDGSGRVIKTEIEMAQPGFIDLDKPKEEVEF